MKELCSSQGLHHVLHLAADSVLSQLLDANHWLVSSYTKRSTTLPSPPAEVALTHLLSVSSM